MVCLVFHNAFKKFGNYMIVNTVTVFNQSDAAGTIFFTASFCAATIPGLRLFLIIAHLHLLG